MLQRWLWNGFPADWLRRTADWCLHVGPPHTLGFLCGALVCAWWCALLTALGGDLSIVCGLVFAAAIGTAAGWTTPQRDLPDEQTGLRLVLLGAWTAVLPLTATWPLLLLRGMPLSWLASPSVEFLFAFGAGCLGLAGPHAWLATLMRPGTRRPAAISRTMSGFTEDADTLPKYPSRPRTPGASRTAIGRLIESARGWSRWLQPSLAVAPSWMGVALALVCIPAGIAPRFGLLAVSLLAAALTAIWGAVRAFNGQADLAAFRSRVESRQNPSGDGSTRAGHLLLWDALPALAAGGLLVLAGRITSQLWLAGPYCGLAAVGGLVAGAALAMQRAARSRRHPARPAHSPVATGLLVLVLAGGLVWSAPGGMQLSLWMNAHVSMTGVIVLLRALACALCAAPAGIVFGRALAERHALEARPWAAVQALLLATGWIAFRWWLPTIPACFAAVAGLGAATAIAGWVRGGKPLPSGRRRATLTAVAFLVAAAGPFGLWRFDERQSARLLFSSRVAAAAQSSADGQLLLALDDERWVDTVYGRDHVWTVWKRRGEWLSLRCDGVPFGEAALDLSLAPEAPAELMAAAVPLAVHPRAEHVLLVGMGCGGGLRTSLEFPLRTLTCLEPDGDLPELLRRQADAIVGPCLADPRVEWRRASPLLASAATLPRRYDVILLNDRQLAGPRGVGRITRESLALWGRHLTPGGLLCARVEYFDLGAAPIQDLARTFAAVFPQVVLWESAPGELLLLASTSDRPLLDEGLLARFSSEHARRTLGRIGWDWSLPLSLITVSGDGMESFLSRGRVARVGKAHFELGLPVEIARWGAKNLELQAALGPSAKTTVAALPESPARADLQKRLADVAEQRSLIARFPDHYWAYRKVLKERLQERPRVDLQRVGLELHPEDERRKAYLQTLGSVATVEHPAAEAIHRLLTFTAPYDPLVTPFVHGEAARLFANCAGRESADELREWLQSVYFGPGFDRSVRDAVSALQILLAEPESLPDAQRRWDHVNALLEVLKERWTLRSQTAAPSRFEPLDAAEALAVAKRAVEFLEEHAAAAGIDPEWSSARCRVIDRTLIRALRTYQAEQTTKLRRLEQERSAMNQSNVTQ